MEMPGIMEISEMYDFKNWRVGFIEGNMDFWGKMVGKGGNAQFLA